MTLYVISDRADVIDVGRFKENIEGGGLVGTKRCPLNPTQA